MSSISAPTSSSSSGSGLRQTFRGLYLRTHADSDVEKSKVMLMHADEIIYDDGYRDVNLDNLSADITASGAGGLDTGSEAASTWYDIYAIRKSSDGTRNVLLHKSDFFAIDVSFTTTTDASRGLRRATSTATDKLAQGVQFATSNPVHFVDLKLNRNAVSGNVWVTLEADSSGNPSGTPLATSNKVQISGMPNSSTLYRFHFRSPYIVTASTQYHLVLQADYTRSDTVDVLWDGVVAGGYANGSAKEFNGTTWSAASGVGDFYFSANTKRSSTITMPSGYDQKCLIGQVFNGSGSDFFIFLAFDKHIRYLVSWIVVSGGTAQSPTLATALDRIPPIRVILDTRIIPHGAGNAYIASDIQVPDPTWRGFGFWSLASAASQGPEVSATLPSVSQAFYYAIDAAVSSVDVIIGGYTW